jgi:hypothetical protein
MNKYYTTIETEQNGTKFAGVVYDSVTNQQVFKSSSYDSHLKAVNEVNEFLKKQLSTNNLPGTVVEISNTIRPISIKGTIPNTGGRRCCGR